MAIKPVSQFSVSIRMKIPQDRFESNFKNAMWILRAPVRLSPFEKEEVLAIVHKAYDSCHGIEGEF